jgi:hypothetical protein
VVGLRRHAWWVLVALALLVGLFGIGDVLLGAAFDPGISLGLTGLTSAELEAQSAAGFRLFDFTTRSQGLLLVVAGVLLTTILLLPYRQGHAAATDGVWPGPGCHRRGDSPPRPAALFRRRSPRPARWRGGVMDWWLIGLRIVHIGSAMIWFGGAIIGSVFLSPTADALGKAGAPFMDHLMKRRWMGVFFPIVAASTILSGAGLYWRASGGLHAAWITSPSGLAFTIGGLAAVAAFVGGLVLIGPSLAAQTAVQAELATSDGLPTDAQRQRLAWAERQMRLANRLDLPLILLAGLTMAVARYL